MSDVWENNNVRHNCDLLEKMLTEDLTVAIGKLRDRYNPSEHRKYDEYFHCAFYYNLIDEIAKRQPKSGVGKAAYDKTNADRSLYGNLNNFYLSKIIRRIPSILDKVNYLKRASFKTKKAFEESRSIRWENLMEINKYAIRSLIVNALINYSDVDNYFTIQVQRLDIDKDKLTCHLLPGKRLLIETEDGIKEMFYVAQTADSWEVLSVEITKGMEHLIFLPSLSGRSHAIKNPAGDSEKAGE